MPNRGDVHRVSALASARGADCSAAADVAEGRIMSGAECVTLLDDLDLVEPVRRAACAIDTIADTRRKWQRANRRPRALSARDALIALQFEALFVRVAAANIRNGVTLNDDDFDRLGLACARIEAITEEVA